MQKQQSFRNKTTKYLKLLSKQFPNKKSVYTEIINLNAICNLPKAIELFISDIHGEDEGFNHIIRNASGLIKNYIEELFGNELSNDEKKELAMLIYYPEEKLEILKNKTHISNLLYQNILTKLIKICRRASSRYTRSKVRKALPKSYAYILEELLNENTKEKHKSDYYENLLFTLIDLKIADDFIVAISYLIQRLCIDHLHIIGDIFDRGNGASKIMDILCDYHSLDIQWGNHDISWMAAGLGNVSSICNVIRIACKYNTLETIEEDYGINLLPLAMFALETYKDDDCDCFDIDKDVNESKLYNELGLIKKIHKAITIMQFKAEANLILKHPEYEMDDRLLLDKIDYENFTITIENKIYKLKDINFQTIDKNNPFELSEGEHYVLDKIQTSFLNSPKLQKHIKFLFNKGNIYTIYNSNLMFHGTVLVDCNGDFKQVKLDDEVLSGKVFLDYLDEKIKCACFEQNNMIKKQNSIDYLWYLWCGPNSPVFGKSKMATFENYFLDECELKCETKLSYYSLQDNYEFSLKILKEFSLDESKSHIINGHVPVKVIQGENPIKSNGLLIVIDGGFSKAYHEVTGISGYTLIYNSKGLILASHEEFISKNYAIENNIDIYTHIVHKENNDEIIKVETTDTGVEIKNQIKDLKKLLTAYENGLIKEHGMF